MNDLNITKINQNIMLTPIDILYYKKEAFKNNTHNKNKKNEIEYILNPMFEMEKITIKSLLINLKDDKIIIFHMLLKFS